MSARMESTGTAEKRSESHSPAADDQERSARLRREVKIGLAVIAVLVVGLSIVLYRRITRPPEVAEISARDQAAEPQSPGLLASTDSEAAGAPGASGGSPAAADEPTQAAHATHALGPHSPPEAGPWADLDPWHSAEEGGQTQDGDGGLTPVSSPPSYMRSFTVEEPAPRYAGRRSSDASDGPAGTPPSGPLRPVRLADEPAPFDLSPMAGSPAGGVADPAESVEPIDPAGPPLPAAQLIAIPQADLQTGGAFGQGGGEEATAPSQNGAGDPTGTRDPAVSLSGDRGDRDPPPDYIRVSGDEPQLPVETTSPHSTYRLAPDLLEASRPVVVSDAARLSDSGRSQAWVGEGRSDGPVQAFGATQSTDPAGTTSSVAGSSLPREGGASVGQDASAADGKYVVQPSDSYWAISNKLYGTGAYFRALAEHNRAGVPDEDRLRVGAEILTPPASELERAYPELCPKPSHRKAAGRRASLISTASWAGAGRVYIVQEGDTVFDIARYELGKASRWVEILQLNRDLLGEQIDYLTPGMRLILPDNPTAGTVTQRLGSGYQR